MGDSQQSSDTARVAGTRSVETVNGETKDISSQVLDIIAVKGDVSRSGPGVRPCAARDRDHFFKMVHPWSITAHSDEELRDAMTRLKEKLPEHGWEIKNYGRNSSRAKTLELTAEHPERKYAVNVEFWDRREGTAEELPKLVVNVVSACYESPEGEEIERF